MASLTKSAERSEVRNYSSAHTRLGRAAEHSCVDCGEPATEWSLSHDTPLARLRWDGGSPFSIEPSDYSARCHACHVAHKAIRPGKGRPRSAEPKVMFTVESHPETLAALRAIAKDHRFTARFVTSHLLDAGLTVYRLRREVDEGKLMRAYRARQRQAPV